MTASADVRMDAPLAQSLGERPTPDGLFAGRWTLVRQVGQGPHSRVFQARPRDCDASRPSDYCIKTLRRIDDAHGLSLLRREALVDKHVAHPNVVTVLAAELDRPPYYLALPFLEGATLERTLAKRPQLPIPMALWIARQAAMALAALHQHRWMHSDVKPTNLFLSPHGHVTLIDMGLARRIGSIECLPDGPLVGAFSYAAPETFSSALSASDRSDVYSLGVTLFRMLAGRLPFEEQDMSELAIAHLRRRAPDVREFAPHLSNRTAWLVNRLLAKEPLRRPDAAELADSLASLEIDALVVHAAYDRPAHVRQA